MSAGYTGRLAPSPTGALHLGNVRTFMIAWLRARSRGGKVILRTEDLDHPRDKPGAAVQAIDELRWLGFDWDEEYVQSERIGCYRQALDCIRELVYPCVCSRKDVESAQSAPHAGEQLRYPGTCRGRFASWREALASKTASLGERSKPQDPKTSNNLFPCWRFRVPEGTVVSFDDAFAGAYEQNVSRTLGDFPLARNPDGAGYTFACTVDDLLMGVTEVVRGDDLLPATPAQILLAKALLASPRFRALAPPSVRLSPPSYCHVPLVVGSDGRRLAKRHGDTRVAAFRAAGMSPGRLLGRLAASCGWAGADEEVSLRELVARFELATIPHTPFMI